MKKSIAEFISIPKIEDDCLLYFAQHPHQIPFKISRFYLIDQAKENLPRGFHAHKKTHQVLFCLRGSIKLILDNGQTRESVILDRPETGIFLPKMLWHEMHDFTKDTLLLVLASHIFTPSDYIRDYKKFLKLIFKNGH